MEHRPYEDWLLNDERLTPEQERDLRTHLRSCPTCSTLARANLSLRAAPVAAPSAGFALRFQARLAAERKTQQRRSAVGMSVLAVAGLAALAWVLLPYLEYLRLEPWQILLAWFNQVVYFAFTVRTLGILSSTLLNVVAALIPPYAWVAALGLSIVIGSVWTISFRRVGKVAQSVA